MSKKRDRMQYGWVKDEPSDLYRLNGVAGVTVVLVGFARLWAAGGEQWVEAASREVSTSGLAGRGLDNYGRQAVDSIATVARPWAIALEYHALASVATGWA